MGEKGSSRPRRRRSRTHLRSAAALGLAVLGASADHVAFAAPIKVACIGEQTTHSHHFPPLNRENQPPATQEYPAMLQTLLGSGYQVRNFGDCCGSVLQGYTPMETHPYVSGALSAAEGPGYNESVAFLPDVVIIGSWGRHDWGMLKATTATWSDAKFETDYDDLVQRYQKLSSHPIIFVSLPIPIPNGEAAPAAGVATSTVLPGIRRVADKYRLPIVDLYARFLGHRELFKQPPDTEGEGEHVTDGPGLHAIADAVYAAMMGYQADGGVGDASMAGQDSAGVADAIPDQMITPLDSSGAGGGSGGGAGSSPDASTSAGNGGSGGAAGDTVTGSAGSAAGAPGGSSRGGTGTSAGCSCTSAGAVASTSLWSVFPWAALALLAGRRRSLARSSWKRS